MRHQGAKNTGNAGRGIRSIGGLGHSCIVFLSMMSHSNRWSGLVREKLSRSCTGIQGNIISCQDDSAHRPAYRYKRPDRRIDVSGVSSSPEIELVAQSGQQLKPPVIRSRKRVTIPWSKEGILETQTVLTHHSPPLNPTPHPLLFSRTFQQLRNMSEQQ